MIPVICLSVESFNGFDSANEQCILPFNHKTGLIQLGFKKIVYLHLFAMAISMTPLNVVQLML